MVRDLDLLIVEGNNLTFVSEAMVPKFQDVGFPINYNIVYRHKAHVIEAIQTPKEEAKRFTKDDQSQTVITAPEFVKVSTLVRRRDVDKYRKIDTRANLNERLQSLEREMQLIDEKLDTIPAEQIDKYTVLHGLKLKYTAEYRLLNQQIQAIKDIDEQVAGADMSSVAEWARANQKTTTTTIVVPKNGDIVCEKCQRFFATKDELDKHDCIKNQEGAN